MRGGSGSAGSPPLTRTEAIGRAGLLEVISYDITVDLTAADRFRSITEVRFRCASPGTGTFIDLAPHRLHSAELNGVPVAGDPVRHGRLSLPALAGENRLVVDAEFAYSTTGQGLTRSVDPVDDEIYLHTHFEMTNAHRVFPCFDQPDLKSVYTWHAVVPEPWRVISNAPISRVDKGSGTRTVHFATSARMSTYVTALCAGPFHEVRRDHDGIDLGYLCRSSLASYLDVDDVHGITTRGFDFFHSRFGVRYPLPKYDQVWVPDMNAGAMENFGCVTLSDASYPFRSRVTDFERQQLATTILHELAHMWFGDLVTMRWWDDLWLNESFAEWAAHWCAAAATRFTGAWSKFASLHKNLAYRQDQLASTHPVRSDVADTGAARLNFDGITYGKGASVLKQLVAYLGEEAFLAGLQKYLTAYAWDNATFDDLLDAVSAASGQPLRAFAAGWLQTTGVDTLRPAVAVGDDGRYTRVAVAQEAPAAHPTRRHHRIAIGLYHLTGGRLRRRDRLDVDVAGAWTEVPALAGVPAADLLLLNDDDLTYAKIRLDPRSLATVMDRLADLDSPLARTLCWASAWDMLRDAELAARSWLPLVLRALPAESDVNLVTIRLSQAGRALDVFADPEWAPSGRSQLASTAFATMVAAEPGSGQQLAWARGFARAARTGDELAVLRRWLDGVEVPRGLAVDTELRWALLHVLVAAGAAGDDEINAQLAADSTADGQRAAVIARALRPTAEAKAAAWSTLVGDPAPPNWQQRALLFGFWHPAQLPLTQPYVAAYHDAAATIWGRRDGDQAREFLVLGYPALHVAPATVAATEALLARDDAPAPARRLLAEARDDMTRALAARAADAAEARPGGS